MDFRSGDALLVFDDDLTIVDWNDAAEKLTGIPAEEAIGRACWDVLGAVDERGSLVCHPGCSGARLAGEGWPVRCQCLVVKTNDGGRRRVDVSTIAVRGNDQPLYVHIMRDGHEVGEQETVKPDGRRPKLTPRQLEVLRLIGSGHSAKTIADELGIAEPTVRNHIRAVLVELHAHSQLAAVAAARSWHLI